MKIKKAIWAVVISLAAAGSFTLVKRIFLDRQRAMPAMERAPKMVECIVAQKGSVARIKNFSGTLKASDSVILASENHGRIEKIGCTQGSFVKKGTILFQLDPTRAVAEFKEAKANLTAAHLAYFRQKELHRKSAAAQSTLEDAYSKYQSAQARLSSARSAVKATQISAPFDGYIGLFSLSVGSHVTQNEELARLISSGPLVIEFQVPESDKPFITVGQDFQVLSEMLDSLPVSAKITAFDPYSDPITHMVRVKGILSEKESGKLRDGAFGNVSIVLGEAHDSIVIPQQAIVRESDFDFAYILINGRAKKVNISLGYNDGTNVQIEEGIIEGQKVIIDPVEDLADGIPVRTSDMDDASDQSETAEDDQEVEQEREENISAETSRDQQGEQK